MKRISKLFACSIPALMAMTSVAFADSAPAAAPARPSLVEAIWPMLASIVILYFFMLKPQKKERERMQKLQQIEKGDEVVTKGGLIGRVTGTAEKILTLEIAEQTRVKIDRDFVFAVNKPKAT